MNWCLNTQSCLYKGLQMKLSKIALGALVCVVSITSLNAETITWHENVLDINKIMSRGLLQDMQHYSFGTLTSDQISAMDKQENNLKDINTTEADYEISSLADDYEEKLADADRKRQININNATVDKVGVIETGNYICSLTHYIKNGVPQKVEYDEKLRYMEYRSNKISTRSITNNGDLGYKYEFEFMNENQTNDHIYRYNDEWVILILKTKPAEGLQDSFEYKSVYKDTQDTLYGQRQKTFIETYSCDIHRNLK